MTKTEMPNVLYTVEEWQARVHLQWRIACLRGWVKLQVVAGVLEGVNDRDTALSIRVPAWPWDIKDAWVLLEEMVLLVTFKGLLREGDEWVIRCELPDTHGRVNIEVRHKVPTMAISLMYMEVSEGFQCGRIEQ